MTNEKQHRSVDWFDGLHEDLKDKEFARAFIDQVRDDRPPFDHIEFSRKGGQSRSAKKLEAVRKNIKKAIKANARKRRQDKRLADK